ncbi:unnamed protein product [Peniophora sp. CBMAI 1063]|nr:unnamed protein product [Peniophora sp. CBMAI 1063]
MRKVAVDSRVLVYLQVARERNVLYSHTTHISPYSDAKSGFAAMKEAKTMRWSSMSACSDAQSGTATTYPYASFHHSLVKRGRVSIVLPVLGNNAIRIRVQ